MVNMVNIKIMCGCGQKYSFDVYPLNGRMPAPVQCPVCGMDGTAAANDILACTLAPPPSAPAPPAGDQMMIADNLWRQRALEAEQRAQEAIAAARANLAPQLAQALKEALVQELAIQRRELLQAQHLAAAEIAQLSQHLDELKAPMQERLRSYETRIQELEKELAARSEENRVLLQLKIEMVRHQLEVERSRNRVAFN
jgi:hypothetical protein